MSGGVDSTAAVVLLQKQGYEVVGVTFDFFDHTDLGNNFKFELAKNRVIDDAKRVAIELGIKHYVYNARKLFSKTSQYFISEYCSGKTPNPCAFCNKNVKWQALLSCADELGIELVATGHYANIIDLGSGAQLHTANFREKDQTFFLWRLTQKELSRTIFPLGAYQKSEIKQLVTGLGFDFIAQKRESYNLCFAPEGYSTFIEHFNLKNNTPALHGTICNEAGEVLGTHAGIYNYTFGTKLKLHDKTWYVKQLGKTNQQVIVTDKPPEPQPEVWVEQLNFIGENLPEAAAFEAKMHYTEIPVPARIYYTETGARIVFSKPVILSAPGQSVVFYKGTKLIGGGIII